MEPDPAEIDLAIVSGNGQVGEPGLPLTDPIVVRVVTSTGGAVEGQVVTFSVTGGRGSVSASSVTSAADGRASTFWTLGLEGGENRVRASVGSASVTFQAFGAPPNTVKGDPSPGLPGG